MTSLSEKSPHNIAIIGGGAAATLSLASYVLKYLPQNDTPDHPLRWDVPATTIHLLSNNHQTVGGGVYADPERSPLGSATNLPYLTMEPFDQHTQNIARQAAFNLRRHGQKNAAKTLQEFAGALSLTDFIKKHHPDQLKTAYMPRPIVGAYLQNLYGATRAALEVMGISIQQLPEQSFSIEPTQRGKKKPSSNANTMPEIDGALISTGLLPRTPPQSLQDLSKAGAAVHLSLNDTQLDNLVQHLPKNARIALVGAGATATEIANRLAHHTNKIQEFIFIAPSAKPPKLHVPVIFSTRTQDNMDEYLRSEIENAFNSQTLSPVERLSEIHRQCGQWLEDAVQNGVLLREMFTNDSIADKLLAARRESEECHKERLDAYARSIMLSLLSRQTFVLDENPRNNIAAQRAPLQKFIRDEVIGIAPDVYRTLQEVESQFFQARVEDLDIIAYTADKLTLQIPQRKPIFVDNLIWAAGYAPTSPVQETTFNDLSMTGQNNDLTAQVGADRRRYLGLMPAGTMRNLLAIKQTEGTELLETRLIFPPNIIGLPAQNPTNTLAATSVLEADTLNFGLHNILEHLGSSQHC